MKISAVHHVQIMIPEDGEAEALHFYTAVLKLKRIPKPPELPNQSGFWLELGETQIHIGVGKCSGGLHSREHVAFVVDNIAEWKSDLLAKGIEVSDGARIEGFRRCELRDPAGNRIEFLEPSES